MKLLVDERELIATNDRLLILTSHRIRLDARVLGRTRLVSITLDSVVSCGIVTRSYPILLAIAALAGLYGVTLSNQRGQSLGTALFVAGLLVVAYFLTRSATLSIASAGAAIEVPASGMGHDALVEFVDAVESAKFSFRGRTASPAGA